MNTRGKIIFGLVSFVVFVLVSVVFFPVRPSGDSINVVIEPGQSLRSISIELEELNLISHARLFEWYARIAGYNASFQAGSYAIARYSSFHSIAQQLRDGGAVEGIRVTIPEGSTIAKMDSIFSKVGLTQAGDFLNSRILAYEGRLFPDTYDIDPDVTRDEIVQLLEATFEKKTADSSVSEQELIIASMLEREVRSVEDMRLVAGIMYARLEIGMPLQIDATVAYGVCRKEWERARNCDPTLVNLVDNIPRDNPYNTYTRQGMPAGPISNPGLAAIEAAKNPEASDYLYYLSARDGRTIFSRTLDEHNEARRKYLR